MQEFVVVLYTDNIHMDIQVMGPSSNSQKPRKSVLAAIEQRTTEVECVLFTGEILMGL